jgi:putative PIN family toxin of toxin-antitoxin system
VIRRVILDTSTLVSAALRAGSVPEQALTKALQGCEVCASAETLDELALVLDRDKFDRYLNRELRRGFVAWMRNSTRLFAVPEADRLSVKPACRDPKDNLFLALAVACEADVLISGDEDLLVLDPWNGVRVLTAREFLE